MPLSTIADYVGAGINAPELLCRDVRNFGVGCARELDTLVRKFLFDAQADRSLIQSMPQVQNNLGCLNGWRLSPEEQARREELLAEVGSLTLAQAVAGKDISIRLEKVIVRPENGERNAVDLLRSDSTVRAELLRIRNFGRFTLDELLACCREAIIDRLAPGCTSGQMLERDIALLLHEELQAEEKNALAALIETVPEAPPPNDAKLEVLLDWGLAVLPESYRDILVRRYGWPSGDPETLQAIGLDLGRTRECIRQIEGKGLSRLSQRLPDERLDAVLQDAAAAWWAALSEPFIIATPRSALRLMIPAGVRLALDVRGKSVEAWLATHGMAMRRIYLSPGVDADRIRALTIEMERAVASGQLPFPLERLEFAAAPWERRAAEIEAGLLISDGFLLKAEPRPRARRAMRLYRLLEEKPHAPFATLHRLYRARHQDDPCSKRDIAIVLHANPHLFPKNPSRKGGPGKA